MLLKITNHVFISAETWSTAGKKMARSKQDWSKIYIAVYRLKITKTNTVTKQNIKCLAVLQHLQKQFISL